MYTKVGWYGYMHQIIPVMLSVNIQKSAMLQINMRQKEALNVYTRYTGSSSDTFTCIK